MERLGLAVAARALPPMRENAEHPQILFDGDGTLTMLFRHWTRQNDRTIGSPIDWENYLTRFDGARWTAPQPLAQSAGIDREESGSGARPRRRGAGCVDDR